MADAAVNHRPPVFGLLHRLADDLLGLGAILGVCGLPVMPYAPGLAERPALTYFALKRICGYEQLDICSLMGALSDPTRLGAIRILWDGDEHCVCELMRDLGATQSRMSRHMAVLKGAGLVIDRRDAQWVRYRRNPHLPPSTAAIVDAVIAALAGQGRQAA